MSAIPEFIDYSPEITYLSESKELHFSFGG
jgi:hypothetical protein